MVSKADAYLTRIFTVEYDLAAMLSAYGREGLVCIMDAIEEGRICSSAYADRFAADDEITGRNRAHKVILEAAEKQAKAEQRKAAKAAKSKEVADITDALTGLYLKPKAAKSRKKISTKAA